MIVQDTFINIIKGTVSKLKGSKGEQELKKKNFKQHLETNLRNYRIIIATSYSIFHWSRAKS